MCGVGFQDARDALIKNPDHEPNAEQPTDPLIHHGGSIEQAQEQQWTETIGHDGESLPVGALAVKSIARDMEQHGGNKNHREQGGGLGDFKRFDLRVGELFEAVKLGLPFAEFVKAPALRRRDQQAQGHEARKQDNDPTALFLRDFIPRRPRIKNQEKNF